MASANPVDEAKELQQLLVDYAKQETVEPLKTLGGYLGWGLGGAFFMFLGVMFLGLTTLRFMQTEASDVLGTDWASLLPYVGALVVLFLLIGVLILAFRRAQKAIS